MNSFHQKYRDDHLSDEEWERLAQQLINAKFDAEKRAQLERSLAGKGISRTPSARVFPLRKVLAFAAAAVLLLTVGWYLFQPGKNEVQQLASSYLVQPFPLYEGNTRGEGAVEKNRGKALEAFNNRQYEKSLDYLRSIEDQGLATAADYFQMALCLMYQKKPDYRNALLAFGKTRSLDPLAFREETNWFAGLCHLLLGEEEAAMPYLREAANSPSSRQQKEAAGLLEKLKQ